MGFDNRSELLECSGADFYELGKELLSGGTRVRLKAHGHSMEPVIRDGDIVEIGPIAASQVQVGDVVLFRGGERLLAHRVIRRSHSADRWALQTQGDSRYLEDGQLREPAALLGRVETVLRGQEATQLYRGVYGLWGNLVARHPAVRRVYLRFRRVSLEIRQKSGGG